MQKRATSRDVTGRVTWFVAVAMSWTLGCATPERAPSQQELAVSQRAPGARTSGVEHVGLAVHDLETTQRFFTEALGFQITGQDEDYPAAFLTDGVTIVTLWQVEKPDEATPFDRRRNIGLHHLAFRLDSMEELNMMYERIKDWPGVRIEFAPEVLNGGPSRHMMFYEPGGIRLEFIVRVR